MTSDWIDFVADNYEKLVANGSDASRRLIALFELKTEYDNGGLVQYLMNSSGNYLYEVRTVFAECEFPKGLEWIESVERVYGGALPERRVERIRKIEGMSGYREGIDPFDAQDQELRRLIPQITMVAEALRKSVESQMKET